MSCSRFLERRVMDIFSLKLEQKVARTSWRLGVWEPWACNGLEV